MPLLRKEVRRLRSYTVEKHKAGKRMHIRLGMRNHELPNFMHQRKESREISSLDFTKVNQMTYLYDMAIV